MYKLHLKFCIKFNRGCFYFCSCQSIQSSESATITAIDMPITSPTTLMLASIDLFGIVLDFSTCVGFTSSPTPRDSILKQKQGNQGLVRTTVQEKTAKIHEYIKNMATTNYVLSEYLRQKRSKKRKHHGSTAPCTAFTTDRYNEWLD